MSHAAPPGTPPFHQHADGLVMPGSGSKQRSAGAEEGGGVGVRGLGLPSPPYTLSASGPPSSTPASAHLFSPPSMTAMSASMSASMGAAAPSYGSVWPGTATFSMGMPPPFSAPSSAAFPHAPTHPPPLPMAHTSHPLHAPSPYGMLPSPSLMLPWHLAHNPTAYGTVGGMSTAMPGVAAAAAPTPLGPPPMSSTPMMLSSQAVLHPHDAPHKASSTPMMLSSQGVLQPMCPAPTLPSPPPGLAGGIAAPTHTMQPPVVHPQAHASPVPTQLTPQQAAQQQQLQLALQQQAAQQQRLMQQQQEQQLQRALQQQQAQRAQHASPAPARTAQPQMSQPHGAHTHAQTHWVVQQGAGVGAQGQQLPVKQEQAWDVGRLPKGYTFAAVSAKHPSVRKLQPSEGGQWVGLHEEPQALCIAARHEHEDGAVHTLLGGDIEGLQQESVQGQGGGGEGGVPPLSPSHLINLSEAENPHHSSGAAGAPAGSALRGNQSFTALDMLPVGADNEDVTRLIGLLTPTRAHGGDPPSSPGTSSMQQGHPPQQAHNHAALSPTSVAPPHATAADGPTADGPCAAAGGAAALTPGAAAADGAHDSGSGRADGGPADALPVKREGGGKCGEGGGAGGSDGDAGVANGEQVQAQQDGLPQSPRSLQRSAPPPLDLSSVLEAPDGAQPRQQQQQQGGGADKAAAGGASAHVCAAVMHDGCSVPKGCGATSTTAAATAGGSTLHTPSSSHQDALSCPASSQSYLVCAPSPSSAPSPLSRAPGQPAICVHTASDAHTQSHGQARLPRTKVQRQQQ